MTTYCSFKSIKKGDNVSDGSEFDQTTKPFTWISNKMTKMKLQGTTMKKLQVKYSPHIGVSWTTKLRNKVLDRESLTESPRSPGDLRAHFRSISMVSKMARTKITLVS